MNLRGLLLVVSLTIVLFGCKNDSEIPEHLLTKEQMTQVLIDIHLSHAKVQSLKGISQDSLKTLFRIYELKLFNDHQVDESIYYESYNFYLDNPDMFLEIYTSVVDSLALRETLR